MINKNTSGVSKLRQRELDESNPYDTEFSRAVSYKSAEPVADLFAI